MTFFFYVKALRANEGNEAQVCFFIIHMLMVKPPEFRNRIHEFVSNNSPEHWKLNDWYLRIFDNKIFITFANIFRSVGFVTYTQSFVYRHEKHKQFHTKFPEKFMFEDSKQPQLPVYFGNVCLRFLPVSLS